MKEKKPRDPGTILEDLKNSDAFIRKTAVEECRSLSESTRELTRTLTQLASSDENKLVAAAARQTLDSPAQQAILKLSPDWKPEESQASQGVPEKPPRQKRVLLFGSILGVISAGIFALPVSLAKTAFLWQGIVFGFPFLGDNLAVFCPLNILGSALFGLLATWLGHSITPNRKGIAWWGFLGGLIFDLLFVFIYFAQ